MAVTSSSGTTNFAPSLGELVLDAFSRCQVRSASLTAEHWFQARLSANLMQSEWSNAGMPLLFKIQQFKVMLLPGVTQYDMPSSIIAPLDSTISQYQVGTGQSVDPVIVADAGSRIAQVTQAQHGYGAGDMAFFTTAIAASGQVLQGPYLVQTVVDQDNYQIEVATPMDGTNSVALPVFATTSGDDAVQITLANHGLSIGKSFYCNLQGGVSVGGLTLSGQLIVVGVIDQDNFTVNIGQNASSTDTATMNSGQLQVATQAPGVDVIDYILYPVSRTEWVSQPDKGPNLQFRPSTFWFQRLRNPVISFWNAPDDNGPYVFTMWAMVQMDDAETGGGVGVDIPYRFLEAYASGLAAKLARKYPPPPPSSVAEIRAEAQAAFQAALQEDIERVPLYISGGFQSYYRT